MLPCTLHDVHDPWDLPNALDLRSTYLSTVLLVSDSMMMQLHEFNLLQALHAACCLLVIVHSF